MMSIIEHAKIELATINFGEEDSKVMIEILEKFFDQWNSGGAVWAVAPILQRLIAGQPLAPITGNDEEWIECGEGVFQNKRCSTVFKQCEPTHHRGGMHPYDIDNPGWNGQLPYDPATKFPSSPVVEL